MAVRIEAHAEPIPGYRLLDRLGSGGFGEVWRAEAPGGIFKAVKIIHGDLRSQDNDLVRYAEQELKSLKRVKQVRHPYLLALDRYDIVEGRLLITMELADCNLWDRFLACREKGLPGIPRDELMVYMAETAEVLDLFNDQFQLQHLDIKPQNLFLLHHHVKVADFGQVKDLQGLIAQVTGGITPVYAAPETFDGIITRYCDQYSLACVYQELLTGRRPFDGTSLSQLLMQHLTRPPDLGPSPPGDRPALTRALAKKPEDRWPSVSAFVRTLRAAGSGPVRVPAVAPGATPDSPTLLSGGGGAGTAPFPVPAAPAAPAGPAPLLVRPGDTPPPRAGLGAAGPAFTPAPPELRGPGPLRPALVIGLGEAGLRVLQRLRFDLTERYGPPERTPAVRALYVDTDPDALDDAARTRPAERLAGLRADEVYSARLNRAAHYTKPRSNGRTPTEGWFDPQLLYKIPRPPRTMGVRMFGRLAFCDHYRPLMGKIQAELETALSADALARTEARTGMGRRTTRPRVYVVAGLAGGTGGGMFLDLAYAARARLREMGYDRPEVVGVLVVPPTDPAVTPRQALGNTYAALTELNHYSRPDTTFAADFDDPGGAVREKEPPFTRCFLVPGSAAGLAPAQVSTPGVPRGRTPPSVPAPASRPRSSGPETAAKLGSRPVPSTASQRADDAVARSVLKPYADAADLIRLNLFTPLGRAADESRADSADEHAARGVTVVAFGLSGFGWPRAEVVARTAANVARTVLRRWAVPDLRRVREVIPAVAREKWSQLGLDPDAVLGHLRRAADAAAGGGVEEQVARATDPLMPRGWLARLPEPEQVTVGLDRLVALLGPPASSVKRSPTPVERALSETADECGAAFAEAIHGLVPTLADDPQFRLAGTEELLRQFLTTTDGLVEKFVNAAAELDIKAQAGFGRVLQYVHFQKGTRKPVAGEFADALREYPQARFRATTFRALVGIYQAVRAGLDALRTEAADARQRVEAVANLSDPAADAPESPPGERRLMPPGCESVDEAAERFLAAVNDGDLAEIDRRAQGVLEIERGGLLTACLDPATGPEGVAAVVKEEARAHLDARLGRADLAGMFAARYRTRQQAERAVEQTYQEAEPAWVGHGPWAAAEVAVVGCPTGAGGEPLRELARRAIPIAGLPIADTPDDLIAYREWPAVPLAALPHLGPAGAVAYQELPDAQQCPVHARLDVTVWRGPDEG